MSRTEIDNPYVEVPVPISLALEPAVEEAIFPPIGARSTPRAANVAATRAAGERNRNYGRKWPDSEEYSTEIESDYHGRRLDKSHRTAER